jgi:hypothetical protein
MAGRRLIFNGKDVQIGYIEGNEVFDLAGRKRCNYTVATGNLCDSIGERVIGHVSLDGTFVGASWLSDELFGKPSGEADADRSRARTHRARHRPKQASVQRPNHLPPRTAVPKEPEKPLAHSQPFSGDPQAGLNTSEKVSDHMEKLPSVSNREPTDGELNPTTSSAGENELLGRAIGMIRSALEKAPQ